MSDTIIPDPQRFEQLPSGDFRATKTFSLPITGVDDENRVSLLRTISNDIRVSSSSKRQRPGDPIALQALSDRYIIGKEIGRGGVGLILEGWDTQLGREIAIKILLPEHKGKPEVIRRFLEEARITSRLQHPGIVPIHELGFSADRRPFFVMRLVRGQTLERLPNHREHISTDLSSTLSIFLRVCQALAYAHSCGVIHRDLKPANIMVGAFDVVNVMDWGLAKVQTEPDLPDVLALVQKASELSNRCRSQRPTAVDPRLPGTQIGTVFGTLAYMSPEQARGEIHRVDKRSDVFGLGSILCEILTGRPPYTGIDGREVYHKAVAADTVDAFTRIDACSAPLDLITLAKWCLSSDLNHRPSDANDVVEVLTAYLQSDQRRAERDMARFFNLSPDLFCIVGADGRFQQVNDNFSRILGYRTDELLSRPFIDFVHPSDRIRTETKFNNLTGCEPGIQFQNRYRHACGHYLRLNWNAQLVPEEKVIYAVAWNVTEKIEQSTPNSTTARGF